MINQSLNNIVVQFTHVIHNNIFINNEIIINFNIFTFFLVYHFIIFNNNYFNDFIMDKLLFKYNHGLITLSSIKVLNNINIRSIF